jgi:hypothetical protein
MIGSSLKSWLKEEGIYRECKARAKQSIKASRERLLVQLKRRKLNRMIQRVLKLAEFPLVGAMAGVVADGPAESLDALLAVWKRLYKQYGKPRKNR